MAPGPRHLNGANPYDVSERIRRARRRWRTARTFPRKRRRAWPVTRAAQSCATTRPAASWRSPPAIAPFHRPCGGLYRPGTRAVASPAAAAASRKAITSSTGPAEAPPRCRISPCCAADTTAPCMRKASRSPPGPTRRCTFVARAVSSCPKQPMATVRARHAEVGLCITRRTGFPLWLGERLDLAWAIDVLRPQT